MGEHNLRSRLIKQTRQSHVHAAEASQSRARATRLGRALAANWTKLDKVASILKRFRKENTSVKPPPDASANDTAGQPESESNDAQLKDLRAAAKDLGQQVRSAYSKKSEKRG